MQVNISCPINPSSYYYKTAAATEFSENCHSPIVMIHDDDFKDKDAVSVERYKVTGFPTHYLVFIWLPRQVAAIGSS